MKNTFLHSDQADLDDSDWIIRRQASEPAPNRQLSGARKQSLEKCVEADENDNSSDSDLDMDNGLFRQSEMDRQTSILSLQGFDKQVSLMSATGLCRQQTEMEWPTYSPPNFNIAFNADHVSSMAEMDSPEVEEASDVPQRKVIGLEELVSAPSSENNMQIAWPQINTMMWPMMWPGAFGMDLPSVMNPSAEVSPYNKNRRKARSLITQAHEQQMRKQKLLWSQNVQLLKRYSEYVPEQQHEELEENVKTWSEPESELESLAASPISQQDKAEQNKAFPKQVSSSSSEDASANQPKAVAQFCPYCGGKVQTRFKFCRYCGHDVAQLWEA